MSPPLARRLLALGVAPFLTMACARQELLARPAAGPSSPVIAACPLGVPRTTVDVMDTPEGAKVFFVTSGSDWRIADLRRRVRSQTRALGPGTHAGPGHEGSHGLHHDHGMKLWRLPSSEVEFAEIERGGVLIIAPRNPSRAAEVREAVRSRVAELSLKPCDP